VQRIVEAYERFENRVADEPAKFSSKDNRHDA
jgi:phosphate starvation-inducible PhoH-like protein